MRQRTAAERLRSEWRALPELGAFSMALPWFSLLPRGDGHPVLVLPGFSTSDRSTVPLRSVLRRLGYRTHGWKLGVNRGPDDATLRGMVERLDELHLRYGQPISLVGWSLGGVYARGMARRQPDRIRQVITLGSPFRSIERDRGWPPPAVPSTAVFSRTDAVVPWAEAMDTPAQQRENVEVESSHFGLGHNPAVILVIADRLAQRRGEWHPFRPPRGLGRLYPD
jgi:pimeloyl-ACP methyl ester carboxylesterase